MFLNVHTRVELRHGHIPGVILARALKFLLKMVPSPATRTSYCEHGPHALKAQRHLAAFGFRHPTLLEDHRAVSRRAGLRQAK